MKCLNLPRPLQLALLTLLLPCAFTARANVVNTYQVNFNYSTTTTLSFDVMTNDGCTICTVSDLVSAAPTNFNFVISGQGSTWDGPYTFANTSSVSLSSFNFDTSSLTANTNADWTSDLVFDSVGATATISSQGSDITVAENFPLCTPVPPSTSGPGVGCPPTPYVILLYNALDRSGTVTLLGTSPVPLPSSALLFGSGLLGLGALRRKGKAQNA